MSRISVCLLSGLLAFGGAFRTRAAAADWPCYRGPAQDGISTESGFNLAWPAEGLKKLWSMPIGDGGRGCHAGAVIAGGKVFVPGRTGTMDALYCFDALSGKELWKVEYEAVGKVEGGYGLGARATPCAANGCVVSLNAFGQLVCVEIEGGKKLWERQIHVDYKGLAPKFGVASAPLIIGDRVLCEPGGDGASIVALELKTGKEVWKCGSDKASYAGMQLVELGGVKQVLAYPAAGLVALDPATGNELWRIRYDDFKNIAAPILSGDIIYLSNPSYGLSAFRMSNASGAWKSEKLWSNAEDKAHSNSAILSEAKLYFYDWSDKGGNLKAVDAANGKLLWSIPCPGRENAGLLRLDPKHFLVNFDNGELALLDVGGAAGKLAARFQAVEGGSCAPSALAGGKLYLRDNKHLVCFELKAP